MLTLTLSPKHFNSPEQAFAHIKDEHCIPELMRSLHTHKLVDSRRYFCVTEFTQRGYPHFHVLVESMKHMNDVLQKTWERLTCTPSIAHASGPSRGTVETAVQYVLKHIDKPEFIADWVWNFIQFKRYSASKFFFRSRGDGDDAEPVHKAPSYSRNVSRVRRSISERVRACGSKTKLFKITQTPIPGVQQTSFVQTLPVDIQELARRSGNDDIRNGSFLRVTNEQLDAALRSYSAPA